MRCEWDKNGSNGDMFIGDGILVLFPGGSPRSQWLWKYGGFVRRENDLLKWGFSTTIH
jgi:hypothetical protein